MNGNRAERSPTVRRLGITIYHCAANSQAMIGVACAHLCRHADQAVATRYCGRYQTWLTTHTLPCGGCTVPQEVPQCDLQRACVTLVPVGDGDAYAALNRRVEHNDHPIFCLCDACMGLWRGAKETT